MSNLLLIFSKCKDCGACCFSCDNLDETIGCVNNTFRLNSRCSSFPVIYGDQIKMGYETNFHDILNLEKEENNKWFILNFDECILLQNEFFFHNLRWMLEDINSGREIQSFSVSFGEDQLAVFVL